MIEVQLGENELVRMNMLFLKNQRIINKES